MATAHVREEDLAPPLNKKQKEALTLWVAKQQQAKNVTTYGRVWIEKHVKQDGKVHCSYNQMVNTGRYSCDNPNLQNIPGGYRRPSLHRSFLIPGNYKNGVYCIADFSGQELAVMACGSEEPVWLDVLRTAPIPASKFQRLSKEEAYLWKLDEHANLYVKDLHATCGMLLFQDDWYKADNAGRKHMRKVAKAINFTIAYGGGVEIIAFEAGISLFETEQRLTIYKQTFRQLTKWLNQNGSFAQRTGLSYSFPPFNRMRKLALEQEDWRKRNIGKNNPVQATGADMVKLSMVYMYDKFQTDVDALLIHQLHDELISECADKNSKKCISIMEECMRKACVDILGEPLTRPEIKKQNSWKKQN
jgi:DNA polymerase-1